LAAPVWDDFKILLALSRGGSVAAAARELQIDNSTVSRRLAALEDALGARLLIRGGREFAWTAEGRRALESAEAMESAAAAAVRDVRTAKVDVSGTVRISVSPAFVPILMRGMLPGLRKDHPELEVELLGAYHRVDLAKGEADIALRMARPEEADLVARRAFDCAWFVYASTAYLDASGRPVSLENLRRHRLVLYVEAMHNVAPLRWMEAYRDAAPGLLRVDNLEIACQTIAADGGVTVLPCMIADPLPGLERVFPEPVEGNTGWIVYHESARNTARVRVVVDALLAFFHANEAIFTGAAYAGSCDGT
jgi:DNA-binding transcriptional LysR family regulator